ncbi:uncharacterized protein G2W53_022073 [Senna tora]|uniref:Uncharacterized protein n=1 Tax=Senna tora TaxID=362788 RepID=A0A834TMD6_9FABA|nr:uncharacterized protein G2W53_022073 [Senna tora]
MEGKYTKDIPYSSRSESNQSLQNGDLFKGRSISPPREVTFEFFASEPEEKVHPEIVREFYANLSFEEDDEKEELIGSTMLRGRKIHLTEATISEWLECPRGDFKRFSNHGQVEFEGYFISKAVKLLAGRE